MTEKELLTGFLSKTLNIDETGVAALYNAEGTVLNDDALSTLLVKDADRVKSLKPDMTKALSDKYSKAVRETMEKFESEFKEKTGFDSELKGVDLVLAYAETKVKTTAEVTDDVVKKHPVYISAMDKLKKESQEAIKAKEKELEDFKSGISKQETFSKVSAKAFEIFNSLKPILSKDPVKAKNQMDDFIQKLKGYEYEMQDDRIVILKDGKALEDKHGHAVTFDTIVKGTAEKYYDFHQTDNRSSTGNGRDLDANGQPKPKLEIKVPQNKEEYAKIVGDKTIPFEQREEIQKLWKEKEAATTV